jgi:hypothetical protein
MYECNTENKETAPGEHEYKQPTIRRKNVMRRNAENLKEDGKYRRRGKNECSRSEKESKKGSAGAGMRVHASSRCQALINPEA